MTLYNLRTTELGFRITKFTDDLNVESSYELTPISPGGWTTKSGTWHCSCPAGISPTCRHRKMLPILRERVDTPWFLDFDTLQWSDPTGAYPVMDGIAREARELEDEDPRLVEREAPTHESRVVNHPVPPSEAMMEYNASTPVLRRRI